MRIAFAALVLGACATSHTKGESSSDAPILTILTPTRGAFTDGATVDVTGTVSDTGPVTVTVAGQPVMVAADGSFSATVTVSPGISFIESHAIDEAGTDVLDVRAVLAGTVGTTDGTQSAPVGIHLGTDVLAAVGASLGQGAQGVDFNGLAHQFNPIFSATPVTCVSARLDVSQVSFDTIDVALIPSADGNLVADVAIQNLRVVLAASFQVACVGGGDTVTISSSTAHIHGELSAATSAGAISTALSDGSVSLDGFNLDLGGVPPQIASVIQGPAQAKVQGILVSMIQGQLPSLVNQELGVMLAQQGGTTALGKTIVAAVQPSQVVIDTTGMFIGLDTLVKVVGGETGHYLSQPATLSPSVITGSTGIGLAIADDVVNQMLGGVWAAGAFDLSVPVASIPVLGALVDPDAVTVAIHVSLPPTVAASGTDLSLAVGDAIISVEDASGATLQQAALSVKTTLSMAPSSTGKLGLTLGTPEIHAQMLAQTDGVPRPFTDDQVTGLVSTAWGLVAGQASDTLANLPMPTISNLTIGAPTLNASDVFVAASASVTLN